MNNSSVTHLTPTCSSLTKRALSGAREIDYMLLDRDHEMEEIEPQKLLLLSKKLQQFGKDADQLQDCLRNASVISPELQTAISTLLPECDAAAAIMIKQIMRLRKNTPREAISMQTILQYESFLELTMRFLLFMTQLLSMDSVESQDAKLRVEDAKLLLIKAASVCQDIAKSGGILLDTAISSPYSSLRHDMLDTLLHTYEAPPQTFEEFYDSAYTKPGLAKASSSSHNHNHNHNHNNNSNDNNSNDNNSNDNNSNDNNSNDNNSNDNNRKPTGGLLNSLTSSFKAATSAMQTKPEPLVVPLCQAATLGNVPLMKFLLNEGANINGRNENGQTALISAIFGGQLDAIQLLLEVGADHTVRDAGRKGKPPLFHAIDAGYRAVIDLLLAHGAAANQSDEWGQPFFVNLVTGETSPEWIALLLSRGADACAKDVHGRPVMILALQNRRKKEDREEVVALLLRHGAKPNSTDLDGTPFIYFCVQQRRDGLVHLLLRLGADPNARDVSGTPLLVTAVKRNDRALTKALLERAADPNALDIYGEHLVLIVLRDSKLSAADREALVEMLLLYGALGGKKDTWGVTALEHALAATLEGIATASPGGTNLKIPKLLLKHGADPNQHLTKQSGEPTLLTYALDRARWDLVEMALSHRANPNLADKMGRTPLLLALQRGKEDVVASLIQHGADVNQPQAELPLDVAKAMGNPEIIQLLKTHGAIAATGPVEKETLVKK